MDAMIGRAFPVTRVVERKAIAAVFRTLDRFNHWEIGANERVEEVNENMDILLTTDINNNESSAALFKQPRVAQSDSSMPF